VIGAFAAGELVFVKEIGVGMAAAIVPVDRSGSEDGVPETHAN